MLRVFGVPFAPLASEHPNWRKRRDIKIAAGDDLPIKLVIMMQQKPLYKQSIIGSWDYSFNKGSATA